MSSVRAFLDTVVPWAGRQDDVVAVALVGSYARGAPTPDSDVDLIVVVDDVDQRLRSREWVTDFGDVEAITHEDWGLVQSVRARYRSSLEVEFGLTTREWAKPPIDAGTATVIRGGLKVLFDPSGTLQDVARRHDVSAPISSDPGSQLARNKVHRPRLADADVQRIRDWHERAYTSMAQRDQPTEVTCLGRIFTVHPKVFPPVGEMMGRVLLDEVRDSDRVLDLGTGSGVNAILAASRSTDIVAVDINPHALACARENASAHGVTSSITLLESDVFDSVDGTFDLIVFDPPFRWFAPRDQLEAAIADENYDALTRFMHQAPSRLRDDGRILLNFGTSADLDYLHELIDRLEYHSEILAHEQTTKDGWTVDYYIHKLTT